jgi:hypothetical protein
VSFATGNARKSDRELAPLSGCRGVLGFCPSRIQFWQRANSAVHMPCSGEIMVASSNHQQLCGGFYLYAIIKDDAHLYVTKKIVCTCVLLT